MRIFISHASEDKAPFVRHLASHLRERRIEVWYDEFVLRLGDSLREKIDEGLSSCDYGIVVLSHNFFAKRWPQQELNGLFSRDLSDTRRFLLPIWHNIDADEIRKYSPLLADRFAVRSSEGVGNIAEHILAVIGDDEGRLHAEGKIVLQFAPAHRYYKNPSEIPKLGYLLKPGPYNDLLAQLRPREIIIAYGHPYGSHEVAGHITSEERMLDFERDWWIAPQYYAVDVRKVIGGFDTPLSKREIAALLGLTDAES
jgi:hypothetical protein